MRMTPVNESRHRDDRLGFSELVIVFRKTE